VSTIALNDLWNEFVAFRPATDEMNWLNSIILFNPYGFKICTIPKTGL
jgi:hypothetical protein